MKLTHTISAIAAALALACIAPGTQPNIVWIIAEDQSPDFGCYGEKTIETPHVDRMASEGVRFLNTFATSPVCSPSRSALITGMHQGSIGAHNHQSSRSSFRIALPEGVATVVELFRDAGYFVSNNGKDDFNFVWDGSAYSGRDWSGRAEGQPFFAQIQLQGGKRRHNPRWLPERRVSPDGVRLPPYYPAHPVVLKDWAAYLDTIVATDRDVGAVLDRIEREGLAGSTYVFFLTDHGISHARGKQFLYDEGIRIPLVVRGPGLEAGAVRGDLVSHIDVAATSLALAGITVPAWMQGRALFAADHMPREAVFSARDRCDETVDRIRSIRTLRFKYIRNYLPARPHLQPNSYKDRKETVGAIREWDAAGRLDEIQRLVTAPRREPEELYDIESDPWEIRNLAREPAYESTLAAMRALLDTSIEETGDRGMNPEREEVYDAEMAVYLAEKTDPGHRREIEANIRQMKQWAAEGR